MVPFDAGLPRPAIGPAGEAPAAGVDVAAVHRHMVAAAVAAGRRVLVVDCGGGEGAAIVAESASEVVAIDVDPLAISRARQAHRRHNLEFRQGSAGDLEGWPDGSFDVAVRFAAGGPEDGEEPWLETLARLLGEHGVLMTSVDSPLGLNGTSGDAGAGGEPSRARLEARLRRHFAHVAIWAQDVSVASRWEPLVAAATTDLDSVSVIRDGGRWVRLSSPAAPVTLVAAASHAPLPRLPHTAEMRDYSLAAVSARAGERDRALARLGEVLRGQGPLLERLRQEVDSNLARIRAHAEAEIDALVRARERLQRQLDEALGEAERRQQRYRRLVESRSWRGLRRLRHATRRVQRMVTPGRSAPETAGAAPTASARPELAGGTAPTAPAAAAAPAALPRFARVIDPLVSVVIPTFCGSALTLRCLAMLAAGSPPDVLEVIVVDDASTDDTAEVLSRVEGIHLLSNERNLGFLGASARGAQAARGRHIVFLNNDTEVRPGWLDALLDAMESADDVGAVGGKLVYPDGTLQEAGGIIWQDGTAMNCGRGGDADAPEYNFRREVDYCSGAALMVRRDLFQRLGGFDTRFTPAYYEDTDLCFTLREHGFRVLYEPRAVIVHHEGATYGSDESDGLDGTRGKVYQHLHRHLFADKWASTLLRHLPSVTAGGLLGGRVGRSPRVLVCDAWIPRHDHDSGGLRMTWIIRLLRRLGCEVTLMALDGRRREPYIAEFQRLGVEVRYGPRSYAEIVSERQGLYDVVVLSRQDTARAWLEHTRRHLPTAMVVYDAVDLEFIRELRRIQLAGETPSEEFEAGRERELAVMRGCDVVAAITETEARIVREWLPGARVAVLPNVHSLDTEPPLPFDERADLLFVGGFDHAPNVDCVRHLVADVLPRIRRHLDARLWLVGSNPTSDVRAMQSPEVVVTGYVPDVATYLRSARLFVAPLRYGAGMKGKVGHAMSCGLPVVTSSIGAEGMDLVDGEHALIRDDPDAFADAAVELHGDRARWERISASAFAAVRDRWTPEAMQGRLRELVAKAVPVGERAG